MEADRKRTREPAVVTPFGQPASEQRKARTVAWGAWAGLLFRHSRIGRATTRWGPRRRTRQQADGIHDSIALGLPRPGHSRSLEECRGGTPCRNGSLSCLAPCCRLDVPERMQAVHRAPSRKPASKEARARFRVCRMRAPHARPARLAAQLAGIALYQVAPARSHGCASHDGRRDSHLARVPGHEGVRYVIVRSVGV